MLSKLVNLALRSSHSCRDKNRHCNDDGEKYRGEDALSSVLHKSHSFRICSIPRASPLVQSQIPGEQLRVSQPD